MITTIPTTTTPTMIPTLNLAAAMWCSGACTPGMAGVSDLSRCAANSTLYPRTLDRSFRQLRLANTAAGPMAFPKPLSPYGTAGLVARDCRPHEGSRHHDDNQRKAAFSGRVYAGICENRTVRIQNDAPPLGAPPPCVPDS